MTQRSAADVAPPDWLARAFGLLFRNLARSGYYGNPEETALAMRRAFDRWRADAFPPDPDDEPTATPPAAGRKASGRR
jgi:hypothetical protein